MTQPPPDTGQPPEPQLPSAQFPPAQFPPAQVPPVQPPRPPIPPGPFQGGPPPGAYAAPPLPYPGEGIRQRLKNPATRYTEVSMCFFIVHLPL